MAKTIVIASGKGGVGKSTTAVALGKILASQGKKVLLVDCDAGLSSLDMMLGVREDAVFSWYDAYIEVCSADEAILNVEENLFLLTAPAYPLDEYEEDMITIVTDELEEDFDIIIRDAPAGLGTGLRRAADCADSAIIVATGDEISVKAAAAVADVIRDVSTDNVRLLINRYEIKPAKKGKLLTIDELIDKSLVRLIGIVPEDEEVIYSTVTRKMKKKSKSNLAFSRIADRLSGKKVDLKLSLLK